MTATGIMRRRWRFILMYVCLMLSACGGSSSEDSSEPRKTDEDPGGVSLGTEAEPLNIGDEPRALFRATADVIQLQIDATASTKLQVSGNETLFQAEATYSVDAEGKSFGDELRYVLNLLPQNFDGNVQPVTGFDIDRQVLQVFDDTGSLLENIPVNSSKHPPNLHASTLGVYELPLILLNAPDQAIGKGAYWEADQTDQKNTVRTRTTVTDISDETISVKRETITISSSDVVNSLNAAWEATYLRDSLLLASANVQIDLIMQKPLVIDGVESMATVEVVRRYNVGRAAQ